MFELIDALLAGGVFVLESILFGLTVRSFITPLRAALLHAAVVTALILWTYLCDRRSRDLRFPLLLTVTTAVLGPFGGFGTLLTILLRIWYARRSKPFEEWHRSMFPDEPLESWQEIMALVENAAQNGEDEEARITPFVDILSFGSFASKQAVVALITRQFKPQLSPVLRLALNDSDNAIRVQAATAITKVEEGFLSRMLELRHTIEEQPKNAQLWLAIATLCDEYAYAGILDREREHECRQNALQYYKEHLKLQPSDPDATLAVGRMLVRERRSSESVQWFDHASEQGHSSTGFFLWRLESLFHAGRFGELRELAKSSGIDHDLKEAGLIEASAALVLWGGAVSYE